MVGAATDDDALRGIDAEAWSTRVAVFFFGLGVSLPLLANHGARCSRNPISVNEMRLGSLVGQAFFSWPTRENHAVFTPTASDTPAAAAACAAGSATPPRSPQSPARA